MGKKSLGSSLSSVLDDVALVYNDELIDVFSSDLETVKEVDVNDISVNPYQPRKTFNEKSIEELALSIENHGLLQPIVIIDADELIAKALENGEKIEKKSKYFLVAGERRLRAIKLLNRDKIRAIIAKIDTNKTRELALLENIQREDLNPIELALAYKELMEVKHLTQEELAKSVQKSRASIANTLRLLTLDKTTQELIINGKISAGHAKVIVGHKNNESEIVSKIINDNLNVRDCEEYINTLKNGKRIILKDEVIKKLNESCIKYTIKKNNIIFDLSDSKTMEIIEDMIGRL